MDSDKLYYSADGGRTWDGPFSREEWEALQSAGVVPDSALVRRAGEELSPSVEAPPSASAPPEPAPPMEPPTRAAAPAAAAPPPTDAAEDARLVMLAAGGKQYGPYTLATLRQMHARGEISLQMLYWMEGMSEWKSITELLGAAAAPPPPLNDVLPGLQGFSMSKFFSAVFTHHTPEELHDVFCCGTARTTPHLMSVDTSWPTPWIFARMLSFCLLLYFVFSWAMVEFDNPLLTPGWIFVGTFGVPFCVFILFFELNVCRDVSLYEGMKGLVFGGLLSIILSLFLFRYTQGAEEAFGAMWAGPVEETGKLLIVVMIASKLRNGRILTGMLLGSAVGAGFAAFESAGYVFVHIMSVSAALDQALAMLMNGGNPNAVLEFLNSVLASFDPEGMLRLRALFAPFAHVLWTAITAGAFWLVRDLQTREGSRPAGDRSYGWAALKDMRFLRIAAIPVLLHVFNNSPILCSSEAELMISRGAAGIMGWIVALRLVQKGLHQIREEQELLQRKSL